MKRLFNEAMRPMKIPGKYIIFHVAFLKLVSILPTRELNSHQIYRVKQMMFVCQRKGYASPLENFLKTASDDEDTTPLSSLQRPPRIKLNNSKSSEKSVSSEVVYNLRDSGVPSSSSSINIRTTAANESSSKPSGEDDTTTTKKILACMVYLKEENSQIIKLLQNNQNCVSPTIFQLPEDLPDMMKKRNVN